MAGTTGKVICNHAGTHAACEGKNCVHLVPHVKTLSCCRGSCSLLIADGNKLRFITLSQLCVPVDHEPEIVEEAVFDELDDDDDETTCKKHKR